MSDVELSPKILRKRRIILRIAREIFAKEGFRNADVQVIADLAGFGKGTVYRHFGNKEQLFLATARWSLEELGEYVEQAIGVAREELPHRAGEIGIGELLRRIAVACAEYYQQHPQAVEVMIQERAEFRETVFPSHLMSRAEERGELERLLQDAITRGELRDVNVAEATNAYFDLIYGSVVNGCLEGSKMRLVERIGYAVDILLQGLVANRETANSR